MSLINEALKKLEKGKDPSDPLIETQGLGQTSPQKGGAKRKKTVFLLVTVIVGLGVGISVMRLKPTALEIGPPPPTVATESGVTESGAPGSPEQAPSLPVSQSAPPAAKVLPVEPKRPSIALESSLVLNGIVHGEGEDMAVINNHISRVGDEVGGAVLLEIGRDFVLIEEEGERFQLKLK